MPVVETLMIVIVGIVALWAFRRTSALERELEFVRRRDQDRAADLADEIARLADEVRALRARTRASGGPERFTADLTVGELDDVHPGASAVLASFHIGGCGSCAVDPSATLAEAAAQRNQDIEAILRSLNELLSSHGQQFVPNATPSSPLLQIGLKKP